MTPTLGSIGAQIDINLRAGDTLGPFPVTLTDGSGRPVNLTGATVTGALSALGVADGDLAMTVVVATPASGGLITFSYGNTTTMTAGDFFNPLQTYAYRISMVDSAGAKPTLLFGYVNVAAGVLA
jgi:hypothetical protein